MNYILLHDSSSPRQANGNKKDQILWVYETHSQTATKKRGTADRCSFPSSLPTSVLRCKNVNKRNWKKEKRTWWNDEEMRRETLQEAAVHESAPSASLSRWVSDHSQLAVNAQQTDRRLILSVLNHKRHHIILDEEDRVCHWYTAHHHQCQKTFYKEILSVGAVLMPASSFDRSPTNTHFWSVTFMFECWFWDDFLNLEKITKPGIYDLHIKKALPHELQFSLGNAQQMIKSLIIKKLRYFRFLSLHDK